MEPNRVDMLLERYLLLLDEYTTLRSTLESLQGAMYQNIARANFSGERGVRYGQDFYDDRMQASRRVEVMLGKEDGGVPRFSTVVKDLDSEGEESEMQEERGEEDDKKGELEKSTRENNPDEDEPLPEEGSNAGSGSNSPNKKDGEKKARERKRKFERSRDPLRWFGLVTPTPLRFAQTQAIQLFETVIPRLASVDAEMRDVEIEVRRARKRRAKAEAESAKARDGGGEPLTSTAQTSA